jgi:mannose PTS system EIIA component
MVHIIVATHGGLARELVHTAQIIVGAQSDLTPVCLEIHEGIEDLKRKFLSAMKAERSGREGYLVMVDMFGGTPSNVSLELSQSHPIKVVTGANLPMLLEAITHRPIMDLAALADFASKKGQQSIFNANELFHTHGNRED